MCASCEQWSAERHDPGWRTKYRRALRGYIKGALEGPGGTPQRDARGRFMRRTNAD